MGQSRNEDILQSIVDGTQYTDPPKSRVEDLLLQVKEVIEEGGSGTGDYDDLENKPQIGGVTLSGNKSAADLSLASLDANGKVPAAQLPSYVDDIINGYLHDGKFYEDDQYTTEITAEDGKIYVDLATNKTYRWSGLAYVEVSESLALGETASTAYAGDKGKANADAITAIKDGQTIDSFGDVETALAGKQGTLTAGDYISLNNGNIAVNRNIVRDNYAYNIKFSGDNDLTVTKSQGGTVISTTQYTYEYGSGGGVTYTIDDAFTLETIYYGGQYFKYTALRDSTTHSAGYTWQVEAHDTSTDVTEYFPTEDLSGYKLVIKSEMDSALSGKQDALTFDDAPTDNSNNPVKSNGIYDALALKQNATDNSLDTTAKTIVGAINEHEGDIGSLKSGLTTLDNEVNGDATVYPYADVITIEDAVPANLDDCSVKVEPVQDLHGQSAPYVGGAGKNKLPLTVDILKDINTAGTWNGNTYTINGGTFTVNEDTDGNVISITANGTFSSQGVFLCTYNYSTSDAFIVKAGTYKFGCASPSLSSDNRIRYRDTSGFFAVYSSVQRRAYETDSWIECSIVINAGTVSNLVFQPMIYSDAETDDSFAPYTNYCPITGHTEASVQRDGVNLFDSTDLTEIFPGLGECVKAPIKSGQTYTISVYDSAGQKPWLAIYLYKDAKWSQVADFSPQMYDTKYTFTAPEGATKVCINGATYTTRFPQCELGSVKTPYVPYAGKTYTIALGDTIYGGTVDFDSGVMTVDRKYYAITASNEIRNNTAGFPTSNFVANETASDGESNGLVISDRYKQINVGPTGVGVYITPSGKLRINTSKEYASVQDAFDNELKDTQFVYELATPFTVQLTPQQIQLLKGTNTLTASTGQISVTVNGVSGSIGAVQEQVNGLARAIGWDDARNIFNGIIRQGYVSNTTGEYVDSATRWVCTTKQECKENTTYTISASSSFLTRKIIVIYLDSNDTIISFSDFDHEASPVNINATITTPDNTAYIIVDIANQRNADGYNITPSDVWNVQIEEGTQITPYIPYHPVIGTAVEKLLKKVPDAPTTDGTYTLTVTVASGVPAYSWVSGS